MLLRNGPAPSKLPTLDKLLDTVVSRLAGALEALRQMHVAEGRPLPDRYSHLRAPRKQQQQQALALLMVNDAERHFAGHQHHQQQRGAGSSGLVMGPLGLVAQGLGGDDRSAAGLAIQHTFGGVSLAAKATKRSAVTGAGKTTASKSSTAAGAAAKRAASGSVSAGAGGGPVGASSAAAGISSGGGAKQQQQDMGVSAAGRQRKRKALYGGDGAEYFVPPVGGVKDEQQQGPVQPHVLPQHHPHHQIRRGAAGDSGGSFGHHAGTAAAAAAAGAAGGGGGGGGQEEYSSRLAGHAVHPQQRHHVQQYPQQRGENSSEGSDGTVYCMCLQAHDQDYFISCDRCGDWCHVKCVGMTIAAARAAKSWCCPLCWAVTGDKGPLTAASERLAKVRCGACLKKGLKDGVCSDIRSL